MRHSLLNTFQGLSYDVHDEMSFEVFQQVMRNPGANLRVFFRRCEKKSIVPLGLLNSITTLCLRRRTSRQPKQVFERLSMLSKFANALIVVAAVSC